MASIFINNAFILGSVTNNGSETVANGCVRMSTRPETDTSTAQFSVDGDVAIITGSSSGIGKGIAKRLAADGVDVVVCLREQENVDPIAEAINESELPGEALALECDVTDREAAEALVEATVERFGGLDMLVNNAGASFMADFDDISPNGWKTIVDINLHGIYHCTQRQKRT